MTAKKKSTIDLDEIHQFESIASEWWDETGPLKPLHKLNPTRLQYIKDEICDHFEKDKKSFTPFKSLSIADIGCGGGLITEPLCRLGATVTGIDAAAKNISVAKQHAEQQGLDINYQTSSVEKMVTKKQKFDVVTALEIIEHVSDPALFISSCCKLVKKNGVIILSTLNRTPKSFFMGIVAAEYILKWVPTGTHDWKKFVKPSELARPLKKEGFEVTDISGLIYNPFTKKFKTNKKDMDVNYILTAIKR